MSSICGEESGRDDHETLILYINTFTHEDEIKDILPLAPHHHQAVGNGMELTSSQVI